MAAEEEDAHRAADAVAVTLRLQATTLMAMRLQAAAAVADNDGLGQGLNGMRERAQLHGGRLTAGPRHGGGFGVHAVLPYRAPR